MTKLVYGKDRQVRFLNAAEKQEAIEYLASSPNVEFHHEPNDEQGAWASEKRFHFKSETGVPEGLKRNFTAGRKGIAGRINCAELYDEVLPLRKT